MHGPLVVGVDALARQGLLAALAELSPLGDVDPADVDGAIAALRPAALVWDLVGAPVPRFPETPAVALAVDLAQARRALAAGARGVVDRRSASRIAAAVRAVLVGLRVVDEPFASFVPPASPAPEGLTARERDVLELLGLGLSNKEIAQRLDVSEHTAKFHVVAIFEKLGATSRTEAVVRAMKLGLLLL